MAETAMIYLVRHAEADETGSNPGLSTKGKSQAQSLAERLQGRGIALILHGPRLRAAQTAAAVGASLPGVECREWELLDDRTPFPSPERREDYSERFLEWAEGVPESERDVDGAVIGSAFEELTKLALARADNGAILAVTHNFVIGGMLPRVLDIPLQAWPKFDSTNAGVTRIECSEARRRLVSFNESI